MPFSFSSECPFSNPLSSRPTGIGSGDEADKAIISAGFAIGGSWLSLLALAATGLSLIDRTHEVRKITCESNDGIRHGTHFWSVAIPPCFLLRELEVVVRHNQAKVQKFANVKTGSYRT